MQTLSPTPEQLKELEQLIRSTLQPCIELKIDLASEPLSVFTSKIGGDPFWAKDEPYPMDLLGYPMFMLAQINFEEMPPLKDYPTDGIVQFFISAKDEQYGFEYSPRPTLEQNNYRIKYWSKEDLGRETVSDFSYVWKSWFDNAYDSIDQIIWDRYNPCLPIYPINACFSVKGEPRMTCTKYINISDFRTYYNFDLFGEKEWIILYGLINKYDLWLPLKEGKRITSDDYPMYDDLGEHYEKFEKETVQLLPQFHWLEHHIGGYANSCQGDPRHQYDFFLDSVVLLGLDWASRPEWGKAEIMFGDSGVANFFIEPERLKQKDFSRVYYNWDCC